MDYYLIANNEQITDKTIENLNIKKCDIIILFNKQHPLKWDKIKEHENKYLVLRKFERGFHGQDNLKNCNILYNKIIFMSDTHIDNTDISKLITAKQIDIDVIISDNIDYNKYVNFKDKIPQTGLITYLFVKNNFSYNKIYLIGFTNEYIKGIWKGHSKEIEQSFYKNEIETNKNIIKIDV